MRWLSRRSWPAIRHRLTPGFALVAYLIVSLGVPLPARPVKDLGQPFPCQDHACGCHSAEECWTHCCCFTHEEHLAWAREHGVEPPAYACKQEKPEPPACCAHHHEASHSCCESPKPPSAASSGVRWVSLVDSQRCRGLTPFGTIAIPSVPPPAAVSWCPWPTCAGWLSEDEYAPFRLSQLPPEPPPRG